MLNGANSTKTVFKLNIRFPAVADQSFNVMVERTTGSTSRLSVTYSAPDFALYVSDATGTTLGLVGGNVPGAAIIQGGGVYLVELAFDLAANGIVQLWVDGSLYINTTHTTDVTATTTSHFNVQSSYPAGREVAYDNIRMDTGTLIPSGRGIVIARQGKAGTPTYNAWTKNNAATAALCWSFTPLSTAQNCSDSVLNDAQTMLVAPFSQWGPGTGGHGNEVLGAYDMIKTAKVVMIAKTASVGNTKMRYRVGGVDTDTTVALTTADAYYQSGFFTDTPTNLDAYEIGVVQGQSGVVQTVEDMWLMVEYVPAGPTVTTRHNLTFINKVIGY